MGCCCCAGVKFQQFFSHVTHVIIVSHLITQFLGRLPSPCPVLSVANLTSVTNNCPSGIRGREKKPQPKICRKTGLLKQSIEVR